MNRKSWAREAAHEESGWRVEGGERDGIWGDNREEEDGPRGKGTPRVGRKEGTPGSSVPRRTGIKHGGVRKDLQGDR